MACLEGAESQFILSPSIPHWPTIPSSGIVTVTFTMKYQAWQATQATNIFNHVLGRIRDTDMHDDCLRVYHVAGEIRKI